MRGEYIEAKGLVDQKRVELSDTADDQGLAEGEGEKAVGEWILCSFPSLLRVPFLVLQTLIVGSHSLDES